MARRTWRRWHLASYPVALMATLHAARAGTDSGNPVFRIVTIGLFALLTGLTVLRLLSPSPARATSRRGGHAPETRPTRSRTPGPRPLAPH
jgi:hypothetical protein